MLCSKIAGSKNLIESGKNGYIIDPDNLEETCIILKNLIKKVSVVQNIDQLRNDNMLFTFEEKFNVFKNRI